MARSLLLIFAVFLCPAASFSAAADELMEARVQYKKGDAAQALQHLDAYLSTRPSGARGPKIAQAWFLKGVILAEQNKAAAAMQAFSAVIRDYPEYPEPYSNLAVLYASQGQPAKAHATLEAALATHPAYAVIYRNLTVLDQSSKAPRASQFELMKQLYGNKLPKPQAAAANLLSAAVPAAAPKPDASAQAEQAVLQSVKDWAAAWSKKSVKAYLAHYAQNFKPAAGESRSAWERSRRERIVKAGKIEVAIEAPRVALNDATHASVSFTQRYRAPGLQNSAHKTLELERKNGNWLIVRERVAK